MPPKFPVYMRPAAGYLEGRRARMLVVVIVIFVAIGGVHLSDDVHKGMPLEKAIGLFALTTGIGCTIVIGGARFLLKKWQLVLNPDGTIEMLGPGAKKFGSGLTDPVLVERSPDGRSWLLRSQNSGKLLQKLPCDAFPRLQDTWNRMHAR